MSKITLPPSREETSKPVDAKPVEAKAPVTKQEEVKTPAAKARKVLNVRATKYPMTTPGGHYITTSKGVEVPHSGWLESQITAGLIEEV